MQLKTCVGSLISAFLVSVGFPEECEIHASMSLLSGISEAMQYDHGTGSLLFVRIKEAEASFSFTVFGAQLPRRKKSTLETYWIKAGNDDEEGKDILQ
jgi:hypothetical protein